MRKRKNLAALAICACLSACLIPASTVHGAERLTEDPGEGRLSGKYVSSDFYETDSSRIMPFSFDTSGYIHDSRFEGRTVLNGIDVSQYQNQKGEIDWEKVAADGVDFVMIRAALRGYGDTGNIVDDTYGEENIQGALEAGLQVGIYFFSQAITEEEARQEADYLVNIAKYYDIELPLAIDYEYVSDGNNGHMGRLYEADLTDQERTDICRAFCERVEQQGYEPMLYGNKTMLTQELYADQISDDYEVWFAGYGTQASYDGDYSFWQYTNKGSVDGISQDVDQDFWYTNPEELRKIDGTMYYFRNGERQSDFEGLVKYENSWYYIKDGVWQQNYEGIVRYAGNGNYYYVRNGKMQSNVSGLIKTDGSWYYISNGKWQQSYTGLVKHTSGSWYYVENGKMKQTTGLVKHTSGSWYYVENGKWQSSMKGLVKHTTGSWYYVEGGKMNKTTGLVKHITGSWYYVKDGKMQKVTTLVKHSGSWYYVADGKWMSSWEGIVRYGSNDYYVKAGRWQKNFNGTVMLNGVRYTIKNGVKA